VQPGGHADGESAQLAIIGHFQAVGQLRHDGGKFMQRADHARRIQPTCQSKPQQGGPYRVGVLLLLQPGMLLPFGDRDCGRAGRRGLRDGNVGEIVWHVCLPEWRFMGPEGQRPAGLRRE